MPQNPELRAIVQRMVDAGESEENIGAVIERLSKPATAPETTQAQHPHARVGQAVIDAAKGAFGAVKAIPGAMLDIAKDVAPYDEQGRAKWPLENTVRGMGEAQGRLASESIEALRGGDYLTAATKGAKYLLPVVGPMMDASGEKMEQGRIAEGVGELATNAYLTALGARPRPAPSVTIKPARMAPPVNPKEAAAVAFAREQGIPLDLATATGNQAARNWQKTTGNTFAGHNTAVNMRRSQDAALTRVGQQLADDAAPSPTNPVAAGEGVRGALTKQIQNEAARASREYSRLEQFEAGAPDELVPTRSQAVPVDPKVIDQRFILRWLADDLKELPYQSSSRMRGQQAIDTMTDATSQEAGRRAVYQPRVAGSAIQDTLNMAGVIGTKAELADRITKALQTGKIDKKLAAVADAYAEAWDGSQFDFDLVQPDTLIRSGVMRKGLKSPQVMPDVSEPGAARFFPDQSMPEVPKPVASESQKLAVDLRNIKKGPLKAIHDDLRAQNESVAFQDGTGKAKALRALDKLMAGPDFQPLSVTDKVLGELKSMARGADMPELRTQGQGIAAQAVKELDAAVRERALRAGPQVLKALEEGRAATTQKYAVSDVLDMLSGEPGQVFRQLTQGKDVGLARLRAVEKLAPKEMPNVARAFLEDLMQTATQEGKFGHADKLWADWNRLGGETKRKLFPKPGQIEALDNFFLLGKKINENPNPSGTGTMPKLNFTELLAAIPAKAAAKIMLTPEGVKYLTTARIAARSPSRASQALAVSQLTKAAQSAGIPLDALPAFAGEPERPKPEQRQR